LQLRDIRSLTLLDDDQVAEVGLEPGDVEVQRLLGLVASAMIDADADGARVLGAEAGRLDLLQGEALAEADLGGILLRRAVHHRSQLLQRRRGDGSGLGGTRQAAALFAAGLVQGQLDLERSTRRLEVLLLAMDVRDDIVVLHHLACVVVGLYTIAR